MKQRDYYWYKLDNAAKLFPAVSTVTATNVFRLTAKLKEDIQPEFLSQALEIALEEMPTFKMKMHKGVFWYYFEHNSSQPVVKEEFSYPCRKIDKHTNNGYLFSVTYYSKHINLEVFHALSDGTGAIKFLAEIVEQYIKLLHPEITEFSNEITIASDIAQNEDSFIRFTNSNLGKSESIVRPESYRIDSVFTNNNEIKVIKGIMPTSQIKALAKEKGITISVLLCSLLIYSIYLESFRFNPKNKPIDICVPVNLRNYFPSETARNFFTSIAVGVNFYDRQYTLDELFEKVTAEFKSQLTEDALYAKVKYGVDIQSKKIIRVLPLFIKNIGLKLAFSKGEKGYSAVMSNLGNVKLPKEIASFIDRFEFLLSPTRNSSYKTSVCSFEDKLVYSFTTNVENTDIQKRFFSLLTQNGVDVTISSNDVITSEKKEADINEQMPKL